jgi:hypothetical protein
MAIMTALDTLLTTLEGLGTPASELAATELRDLAGAKDGWQALALDVAAQAIEKHGPDGLKLATRQLTQLAEGKITVLDVADARTSHAILAAMEQDESVRRRDVRDYFAKLGTVVGSLGSVFLGSVVKGALGGIVKYK